MVETHQNLIKRLTNAGIFSKKNILDNKISKGYKEAIEANRMDLGLVPVGVHRRNVVQKTTQIVSGHFKSILCGVANDFPINKWDRLISQEEITVNILHQSNVLPKVSARAYAFGPHNFNRIILAPIGCAVQINEKLSKWKMWGVHSVDGWYLQTSPHHYRCFEVWSKDTGAEQVSDTVFFKHKHITNPTVSPEDAVAQAEKELTAAFKSSMPSALEGSAVNRLKKFDKNFNQTAVTYKESRDYAPPPQWVRKETATPQRVMRTQPPCHPPPCE